jgi:hypothetical protein
MPGLEGSVERPKPRPAQAGPATRFVVTMPRAYLLRRPARGRVRNVILPVKRGGEMRPGGGVEPEGRRCTTPSFAWIAAVRRRARRSRRQPGFTGMQAVDVQDPDGHFLGWAPAAA